jgi:hypothetical protein
VCALLKRTYLGQQPLIYIAARALASTILIEKVERFSRYVANDPQDDESCAAGEGVF